MGRFRTSFTDPTRPDRSDTLVHCPDGSCFDVTDPQLADLLHPDGARVLRQDRGSFDMFPLSLITTQTLASLSQRVDRELEVARFRPNLLIDATGRAAFCEDRWVGRELQIGGLRMRVDRRDGRCLIVTLDPQSGEREPEVLRRIAQEREGCLGVYGSVVIPGPVAIGDVAQLQPAI